MLKNKKFLNTNIQKSINRGFQHDFLGSASLYSPFRGSERCSERCKKITPGGQYNSLVSSNTSLEE